MDDLINKYAAILKNAKIGDFTYEGILAEFASEVKEQKAHCGHTFYKLTKGGSAACGELDCNNYIH